MKNILSIDIGTSSIKAAILNSQGECLTQTTIHYTADVNHKTANVILNFILPLIKTSAQKFPIDGICISGNGPTLVSTDGTTLFWNETFSENTINYNGTSIYIPRLILFKEHFSSSFTESQNVFSLPEYIVYKLTEKKGTTLPEERFLSAYWDENSLLENGFTKDEISKLPEFVNCGDFAGTINIEETQQNINIYFGAPDFISALVGTNTLSTGKLMDRAGTSEGLNFCCDKEIRGENIRTLPSIISGLWNISFLLPTTGKQFSDFKKNLEEVLDCDFTYDQMIEGFLKSDGSIPLFDQGKYLMIQIALEVQNGLKQLSTVLWNNGIDFPQNMMITGGQAKNLSWLQMKSNITNLIIDVPEFVDAELIGNACFALTSLKEFNSIQEAAEKLCKSKTSIYPQEVFED